MKKQEMKRTYQSPATQVVKLAANSMFLDVSTQQSLINEVYNQGGTLDDNF